MNTPSKKMKMESTSCEKDSKSEYVLMPWDDKTEIIVSKEDGNVNIYSRWELIQEKLNLSNLIKNVKDLIEVIKSYNVVCEKDGRQSKPLWKCFILQQYFFQLEDYEKHEFFEKNGILSTIRNLTLQLHELVPNIKILKSGGPSSITFHQLQIASLLANAFLCTFPKGKADCPSFNFNTLYESNSNYVSRNCIEKIKCIMHYFKRIHCKQPTGNLSIHRLWIPDHKFPRWDKTNVGLCSLKVDSLGMIEDQVGFLQMDFANRYIGGGVLGRGCVQEEIRFVVCPELIAARLFTESLSDNEALLIIGAERYCQYKGYADTFKFTGDYKDSTPLDENMHRQTYIIVLDALFFHRSSEQYRESKILRELKKAYVGFKPSKEIVTLPLATGNWGCGAFGGDPQLKSILQLMASSQAQRDMLYLTFGDSVLKSQIQDLYDSLKNKNINVGMLYCIIRRYNKERRQNQTLFEFIKESIFKPEKRKISTNAEKSSSPRQNTKSTFKTAFLDFQREHQKPQLEKPSISQTTEDENFPNMNIDFDILEKEIENQSNDHLKAESHSSPKRNRLQNHSSLSASEKCNPSHSKSVLDVIWFESEVGCGSSVKRKYENQSECEKSSEKMDTLENSPSLFSEDEVEMTSGKSKNIEKSEDIEMCDVSFLNPTEIFKEQDIRKSFKKKTKLLQPKITDLFKK